MQQKKIIWFAIVFSTIIYLVLVYVVAGNPEGSMRDKIEHPLVLGLYGAAAAMFAMASVVPQRLGDDQKAMILALALFESCAVFGLVAAFLEKDWRLYIVPWVLALIGFVRAYPGDDTRAV